MKRLAGILFIGLIFFGCSGHESNTGLKSPDKRPVTVKMGSVTCPQCRMPIKRMKDETQLITKEKNVWVFDDPGCMVLWMQKKGIDPKKVALWAYTRDTSRWVDAKKCYYSQTDATPMGYGFGAYEKDKKGRISFDQMRLRMLRGLTLKDPKIRKKLLGY